MISVEEAKQLISTYVKDWGTETVDLLAAGNRTLAEDVYADRDFPPFDRVTMDGVAISSRAFAKGNRSFFLENISAAGSPQAVLQGENNGIEVMTGTVLPLHTDAVIPYEQCEIKEGAAHIKMEEVRPFQNVHRQGTDERAGAVLLSKNKRITPAYISLLATVGKGEVLVYKLPSVAVCSTGDELVAVEETPLPHQIRRSNSYLLAADLQQGGITPDLFHIEDNKAVLKEKLQQIIETHDVLLLSGAVSKGKWDFLPEVLQQLGLQKVFHRLAQKPGKPFLFGVINSKPVFGFPGNPVSTFVCYHLFCTPWLMQCFHQSQINIRAMVSSPLPAAGSLTNHVLVGLKNENGVMKATPLALSTSGDMPALIAADGILSLPPGDAEWETGDIFDVVLIR